MDLFDLLRILGGLILLVLGGDLLVRGATGLGTRLGISRLVMGLTIVSIATSAPELSVSFGAVLRGNPELAVGNVVGSNIANVLLILGSCAVLAQLAVSRRMLRFDLPFLVGISAATWALGLDGLAWYDGLFLLLGLAAFLYFSVLRGRQQATPTPDPDLGAPPSIIVSLIQLGAGVAMLIIGADFLVDGASSLARSLGISDLVIGLTVVAIGTSLPELAASIMALRRGAADLAIGNAVGSNIANLGLVLGLPALVSGGFPLPSATLALDLPLAVGAAVVLVPICFTQWSIGRAEGAVFLALYAAYTTFILLRATQHEALQGFTTALLWFLVPLLGLLIFDVVRFWRSGRSKARLNSAGIESVR